MIARLGRRPFAWGWLVCALGLGTLSALAAEPSGVELQRWTAQLDTADFAVRERAAERLLAAGGPAIEPLVQTMRSGSAEASWRAASTLVQIAIRGDDDAFARAVAVLSSSDGTRRPFAAIQIEELGTRRAEYLRRTAEASIRSLGGVIGLYTEEPSTGTSEPEAAADSTNSTEALDSSLQKVADAQPQAIGAIAPPPELPAAELAALTSAEPMPAALPAGVLIADAYVAPELQAPEEQVELEQALTLNQAWRGGDDGLSDLRHLPDIVSVRLEQAAVSDAALKYISVLPRLRNMRIIRTPVTPSALGVFRQRHPNVAVFISEQAR